MKNDKLITLGKGRGSKLLLELCEEIKMKIADIRTPLKVKAEIENQVRLGVIEALDIYLVEPLKVLNGAVEPPRAGDAKEFE